MWQQCNKVKMCHGLVDKKLVIFLPEALNDNGSLKNAYLFGKIEHEIDQIICYVTNYSVELTRLHSYVGVLNFEQDNYPVQDNAFLNLKVFNGDLSLKSFKIDENESKHRMKETIFLLYNSSTIFHSINFQNGNDEYVDYFRTLQILIRNSKLPSTCDNDFIQKPFRFCLRYIDYFLQVINRRN